MLCSVRVTRLGDTDFLVDEQVDRFCFMEENEKVMNRGGEPADGTPLLLSITKASLSTRQLHLTRDPDSSFALSEVDRLKLSL